MHKSDFPLFPTRLGYPQMRPVLCSCGRETLSAPSGLVPPARRDSFAIRMANKTTIMAAAWQTKGALRLQNQNVMKCL